MEGFESDAPEMSAEEEKMREEVFAEVFEDDTPEHSAVEREDRTEDDIIPESQDKDQESVPAEPENADPFAGVDPAVRQHLEAMTGRLSTMDALENRLKQAESRVGSMQNEFYAAKKAAEQAPAQEAPSKKEMEDAAVDSEAWEELKDEYPIWAAAIESKLASIKTPDVSGLENSVNEIRQGMVTNEALEARMEARLVAFTHPDWQSTVNSAEYQTWLKAQPQDVQQKHYHGGTAEDAIYVLDRFKARNESKNKEITDARKRRLSQAAATPKGRAGRPPKSEMDMTEAEIRAIEAKNFWG